MTVSVIIGLYPAHPVTSGICLQCPCWDAITIWSCASFFSFPARCFPDSLRAGGAVFLSWCHQMSVFLLSRECEYLGVEKPLEPQRASSALKVKLPNKLLRLAACIVTGLLMCFHSRGVACRFNCANVSICYAWPSVNLTFCKPDLL